MSKIKALVFDLGNVLIFFDWNIARDNLNKIETGLGEKVTKFLKEKSNLIYLLETGRIDEETFLSEIKNNINSRVSKEELAKIFSDIFWENEKLTKILPKLQKNYKLYLLSNTNIIHRKFGWDKYDFLKYFDALFLSYEIGFVKPEKEIFEFVEKKIPFSKEEFIYIDDVEDFVNKANSLGWNVIRFTSNEELFTQLKNYELEV
ncbi:MAG: HAD family phosphatase [Ignavibacteria bacterium]|nr:HAD family phosphatase [Ignavibacteria bacterium]